MIDSNNLDQLPLVVSVTCKGDFDGDNVVSDFELLSYIDQWVDEEVTDFSLLEAIDNWVKGSC